METELNECLAVLTWHGARPEKVAELVAFLVSDRVSFSTGDVYDISGGRVTY